MKHALLVCLVMVAIACKQKPQPVLTHNTKDSIIPAVDTAYGGYSDEDRIKDSLQTLHERDSFYAIKPITTFISDAKSDAYKKLISTIIDTNGVTRIPLTFSDTIIRKFDKDQMPVSSKHIYKNNRFIVEAINDETDAIRPIQLFINGQKIRAGIELDTALSGTFYEYNIELDPGQFDLMKFGNKAYLHLPGYVYNCTGSACGVEYHLLYDPVIRKAMLMELFRADFIYGYDKTTNSPVFIDAGGDDSEPNILYQCFIYSGKAYRLTPGCKIKPVLNKAGKQYQYSAYSRDGGDTVVLLNGITR